MDYEQIRRFAYVLFGAGIALLGEHIIVEGFVEWDPLGHETYGLVAILISVILLWRRKPNKL